MPSDDHLVDLPCLIGHQDGVDDEVQGDDATGDADRREPVVLQEVLPHPHATEDDATDETDDECTGQVYEQTAAGNLGHVPDAATDFETPLLREVVVSDEAPVKAPRPHIRRRPDDVVREPHDQRVGEPLPDHHAPTPVRGQVGQSDETDDAGQDDQNQPRHHIHSQGVFVQPFDGRDHLLVLNIHGIPLERLRHC